MGRAAATPLAEAVALTQTAGEFSFLRAIVSVLAFVVFVFAATAFFGRDANAGLSREFAWQFRLAASLRTPMLMYIVVPLSALQRFRTWVQRKIKLYKYSKNSNFFDNSAASSGSGSGQNQSESILQKHEGSVHNISRQIKLWDLNGRKNKIRTARPNWAAMSVKLHSNKGEAHKIEVGHLKEILEIDTKNLTVKAEPGVTMGELTDVLLPLNLALQTHVEMEAITLGGLAMGFGIETNSYKFGLFQESVVEYELVDSKGEVHHVTHESDPELFYALPWSHGTLGMLVGLKVKLVRTKPFIRMLYEATHSPDQLQTRLSELAAMDPSRAPDFLEATLYTKNDAVIQAGWYADLRDIPKNKEIAYVNSFYKPFFFRHVETFLDAKRPETEYIPLKHFLHRFTRSIFWELEDMIPFSNHPVYRCLWGWWGPPEVSLLKLFQGPVIRKESVAAHVVQESIMPLRRLSEGIEKFDCWFGVYPLLVFPTRVYNRGELSGALRPRPAECRDSIPAAPCAGYPHKIHDAESSGLWVDLGAYGPPREVKKGRVWDAKKQVRAMEHWTREVGGFQALYTDIFCTPKELGQMFDFSLLNKVRARLECLDAFPEVYEKVQSEPGISDLSAELAAEQINAK
mmetsp:Transcript_24497/g.61626  ORF Transcript_24497/g.61626 Transcript_24497/m.61626 type:complete len:629 (+) Transcript_24497:78-1964(+)|eukprot:CAMPEP_0178986912 /NCGR_PEP_ID=MMETSP0795-20121207/2967_1 /TAXON_ID=88552 /ORGANISM="Amoebophrya sp., Strain Ameob2" /LENGTH=628 /DNA_ID=CAMNT_0020678025 /DNA_START=70 /DNA_END=1956 /DNA_ORIENTATION=-